MQTNLSTQPFASLDTEALVTYVFEEADPVQGRLAEIDQSAAGLLRKLHQGGEFAGKTLEFTLIHAPAGHKAARLLLVGAGKREQFNPAVLRKVAGAALRYLKSRGVHKVVFLVRESDATEAAAIDFRGEMEKIIGRAKRRGSSSSQHRRNAPDLGESDE